MGVAGSGKTSVGRLLAERLESDFLEGDRRHPAANIAKMLAQQPLSDRDRQQWLSNLSVDIHHAIANNREIVLTCSALKVSYRQQLMAFGRVQLVWLEVPTLELARRLTYRTNHYMQATLLSSQINAFEPIQPEENVMRLDGQLTPAAIVDELLNQALQQFPSLREPWWQRL